MAEQMDAREEVDEIKAALMRTVDDLERAGISRAMVGAGMVGIGAGIFAAHRGNEALQDMVQSALDGCRKGERSLQ